MNFARDVVDALPRRQPALVELTRNGARRVWSFGEVADRSARLGHFLRRFGVQRADVVMIIVGNRPDWVFSMLACLRIGAIAFPCNEQLRSGDIALRLRVARPRVVICDERNSAQLEGAAPVCPVLYTPNHALFRLPPTPSEDLGADDPSLIVFTSGTSGTPKAVVHSQKYFFAQRLQAVHWLGARPGQVVWCTTASGWSKSARNVFIGPWLCGATALIHDARFDPLERLEIAAAEHVNVLCMTPTEYRMLASALDSWSAPDLAQLVSAGERLDRAVLQRWFDGTGLDIRDGYGQTETGHLVANRPGKPPRQGSMGRPLPGVKLWTERGELVVDSSTVPTFFHGYLGTGRPHPPRVWRTGDLVNQDEEGYFYFEGRVDDVIVSAGYRIGPDEVETALMAHPAVAEAAVVAKDDLERGAVVKAILVLAEGWVPSADLTRDIQHHVKTITAPYKYPRVVEYVPGLPRTSSGKLKRADLR
jgi:acetyl-CoA synthetase